MNPRNTRNAVDPVQQFEELEDRILEELATVRKLKRIFAERCHDGASSPEDTVVIRRRANPDRPSIYDELILTVLAEADRRLTLAPLREAIRLKGHYPSLATIKRHLKHLQRTRQIDNDQNSNPPGYGLICDR
jgi:hypothetical protein